MRVLAGCCMVISMIVLAPSHARGALPEPDEIHLTPPLYYGRVLSEQELQSRTLVELTLMRNWIYARAGNPFRKAWLRDFFMRKAWYHPGATYDPARLSDVDRQNLETIAGFEVAISKTNLENHLKWIRARIDPSESDRAGFEHIEGELTAARLGVAFDKADSTSPDWSPLADPRSWDRQLTLADLSNMSRRDLRILRNIIYARRGRPFKSASMREYFSTLEWYEPKANYSDASLTALDRRNVKLILDLEQKLGGPMTEAESAKLLDGA